MNDQIYYAYFIIEINYYKFSIKTMHKSKHSVSQIRIKPKSPHISPVANKSFNKIR